MILWVCRCEYVCVSMCVLVCVLVCVCEYDYVSLWVCEYVSIWVCDFVSMWVCEYMSMWVCECVCGCECVCNQAPIWFVFRASFDLLKTNTKLQYGWGGCCCCCCIYWHVEQAGVVARGRGCGSVVGPHASVLVCNSAHMLLKSFVFRIALLSFSRRS